MKKFERKFSIVWMCLFAVLFAAITLFTFVPMKWGSYNYNSAFKAIKLSDEFNGKLVATYSVKNDPSSDEINSSISKITKIVESEGYSSVAVKYSSDKKLSISVANPSIGDDYSECRSFLSSLSGGEIIFSTASAYENIDNEGELTLYGSKNFKDLRVVTYSGNVGLQITYKFTSEEKNAGLNEAVYKTLYMYRDGEAFPSSSSNTINQSNTSNSDKTTLWFRDTESNKAYDSAVYYKKLFETGTLALNLDGDTIVFSETDPTYSSSTLSALNISLIIILALFVGFYVYEIVRWRALGVISFISVAFVVMISIFIFAIMPWFTYGIASFVGIIVSLLLIILTNSIFINKISSEHKLGKSISTSVQSAYKKMISYSTCISVVMFATGIAIALIGQTALASLGIILSTAGVMNIISSLGLTRLFIAFYQSFNEDKPKCYGLDGEDK